MTDSFADLWNSEAPSKPVAPQKLASIQSKTNLRPPQNDLFSQLSSAGSGPPSRTMTPSYTSSTSPKPSNASSSSGDAFSSLFASGSGFSSKSTQNMTIAQRAEEAERKRREQLLRSQNQQVQNSQSQSNDAWAGLDSLGGLGGPGAKSVATEAALDDDWGFGSSTIASATSASNISAKQALHDDWGLGEFSSSKPAPSAVEKSQTSGSLWDLDDFTSPVPTQSHTPPSRKADSPSHDFDFGNREDNDDLLGGFGSTTASSSHVNSSPGEDDILGALSRPVDEIQKERERVVASSTRSSSSTSTPNPRTKRSSSPPPHILGRLVEMGFGINEAKVALVATQNTESGEEAWVQNALEVLINNGAGGSDDSRPNAGRNGRDRRARADGWGSDDEGDETRGISRQSSSLQRKIEPGMSKPHARREPGRNGSSQNRTQSPNEGDQATNLQEQADKLFSQASEIGKGLFSRANAAWKEGKERVQKAYEEQYGGKDIRKPTTGGRPVWMVDGEGFKDDEHEARANQKFRDEDELHADREREHERRRRKPEQLGEERVKEATSVDLFSSSEPTATSSTKSAASSITGAYVSKWRHGRPKDNANGSAPGSGAISPSNSLAPAAARNRPIPSSRPRTPPRPHPTTRITASTSSLSLSSQHKLRATSAFKLGDYPVAEAAYSQAIEVLPEGHALCILLYNNRALTRLKMGNLSGVLEDTGVVCQLVGSGETSAGRGKISVKGADDKTEDVNLGDALVKAWKRRAEALEGNEKWEEAGKDWEAVAGAEWAPASIRGEGVRGAGRCRRMVNQPNKAGAEELAVPKPKPKAKPISRPPVKPNANSQAVSSFRAANAAAESEDVQKHALKDSVDAKLLAWKGGKETNIRALLASLDTILWPELGVQKLNMSELITEGQVKIKYMKAIGKVHPDKLNPGNSTVEQRMIAGGVFGALNEAWNAFKP